MARAIPRHSVNLSPEVFKAMARAMGSGQVWEGDHVAQFEKEFARYIGVKHAVGISSARAGLYLALRALGLEPQDEVILAAYNFHIIPLTIIAAGLRPVFVDVDPETYNIDISSTQKRISKASKAVIATHLFGQPSDMGPILEIAKRCDLKIIEDCAHSLGAEYEGRKTGSWGDIGIFSFAMGKNMPCFGGGMITTNDSDVFARIKERLSEWPATFALVGDILKTSLAYAITDPRVFPYILHPFIRVLDSLGSDLIDKSMEEKMDLRFKAPRPFRLTDLQAAVGLCQLGRLDTINARLIRNAQLLNRELKAVSNIQLPEARRGGKHIYLYYRILVEDAKMFRKALLRKAIDSKRDDMSDCAGLDIFAPYRADCPVAGSLPARSVGIPNTSFLRETDVSYISKCIREIAKDT